jgi:ribonucleoside-diphosphate reductase alpha chain
MTTNPQVPVASSLVDYIFRWLEVRFLKPGARPTESSAPANAKRGKKSPPKGRAEVRGQTSEVRDASSVADRPGRDTSTGLACPDCGSILVFAEGCLVCRSCGYNKCG